LSRCLKKKKQAMPRITAKAIEPMTIPTIPPALRLSSLPEEHLDWSRYIQVVSRYREVVPVEERTHVTVVPSELTVAGVLVNT